MLLNKLKPEIIVVEVEWRNIQFKYIFKGIEML